VRLRIRRRGGLAGVALCADLDTAEFGSQTAARVDEAVSRLLSTTGTATTPKPDAFEYEITVPGRGDPVLVGEHEMPSELEPLIEKLSQVGRIEASRRSGPTELK
jgi:hypothetical protein